MCGERWLGQAGDVSCAVKEIHFTDGAITVTAIGSQGNAGRGRAIERTGRQADDRWVVIDDVNDQGRAGAGIACAVSGFGGLDCVRINLTGEGSALRCNPVLLMAQ